MSQAPLLVLVGAPAAWKSRLGKRVSYLLGVNYVDTDSLIQAEHGLIPQIFQEQGEPVFRSLERAAVLSALATDGVVSLGGGAIINPDTRRDLHPLRVAWVTISPEAVEPRIQNSKRPLLAGDVEGWKRLVAERDPWYREVADEMFDTSNRPIDHVANDIVVWLETQEKP